MAAKGATKERAVVIARVFNTPRKFVWKAWTEEKHFKKWWGPKDFTCPVAKMDVKPGGKYLWCMKDPAGKEYWTTGEYREVTPMDCIVYTDNFSDAKGNIVAASAHGLEGDFSQEMLVTVTLEDQGDKTKLTLRHTGMPAGKMSEMASEGWNQSFDKMAESFK